MNERAPLREAVDALRDLRADHDEAKTTEERVLTTLKTRAQHRRWAQRSIVSAGLVLFVAAGSQAAYHGVDPALRWAASWLGMQTPSRTSLSKRVVHPAVASKQAVDVAAEASRSSVLVATPNDLPTDDGASAEAADAGRPAPPERAPTTRAPTNRARPRGSLHERARAPEVGAEELYARAHHLHFAVGDKLAALAGWDRYLFAQPSGGLAPEARYNRALCLIALGRTQQAVDALSSIAEGADGNYRQREARRLLRVLSQRR